MLILSSDLTAHMDWTMGNLKTSIFHQMHLTLNRFFIEQLMTNYFYHTTLFYLSKNLTFSIYGLWKIARAVYDVEEATATALDIILEHKVSDVF